MRDCRALTDRALAVWLTIGHHLTDDSRSDSPTHCSRGISAAGDGVGIFFVLSGFLITNLLLKEYERSGRIDLSDFYLRRVCRIQPPLYVYLLFRGVVLLGATDRDTNPFDVEPQSCSCRTTGRSTRSSH